MLGFGGKLTVLEVFATIQYNIDNAVVGKVRFPRREALGVRNRWLTINVSSAISTPPPQSLAVPLR